MAESDFSRYQRQMLLPEIGEHGQKCLADARVLIVGVGGLGSPLAMYLAGAGVGHLGIVDCDVVSVSNLHRQVLYTQDQVGQPKVYCAQARLKAMNPDIEVMAYNIRFSAGNAKDLVGEYDIVVDGSDNFETRYLLDDVCADLGKPYVFGAICGFRGQVSVFGFRKGLRYRDVFPEEDAPSADIPSSGPDMSKAVVGMTASLTASVQAMEVIKIICGIDGVLDGILWTYNLLDHETGRYNFA